MTTELTGLLVADASRARLYAFHKAKFLQKQHPQSLTPLQTFDHPDSRKKTSDLVSDKMGADYHGNTMVEDTLPKEREAEVFAHILAKKLESALTSHEFRDVILVAPPHFMGLLNKMLPKHLKQYINQEIEKDYTHLNDHELVEHLEQHF